MAKFESVLAKFNKTADEMSAGLKKKIKEYGKLQVAYENVSAAIKNEKDANALAELKADSEDIQAGMKELDNEICEGIEAYAPKAEEYKQKMAAMRSKGNGKAGRKPNKPVETAPATPEPEKKEETPTQTGSEQKTETPPAAPAGVSVEGGQTATAEPAKKKSNAGWYIAAGVVALVTLGAVNLFNKK